MMYNLESYIQIRKFQNATTNIEDWALAIFPIGSLVGAFFAGCTIRLTKEVKFLFGAAVAISFVLYCCLSTGRWGDVPCIRWSD